jgi:hypothetical protein
LEFFVRLGFLVSVEGINGRGTMEEDEEIHARSLVHDGRRQRNLVDFVSIVVCLCFYAFCEERSVCFCLSVLFCLGLCFFFSFA